MAKTKKGKKSAQKKFQLKRPKKSTVKSITPIIEMKKFRGLLAGSIPGPETSYMSITAPTKVVIPAAFMYMSQTAYNNSPAIEGNDIFSRYLTMKFKIQYPSNSNAPPNVQVQPTELIWGWCKPTNYTSLTSPVRETVSRANLANHVANQIAEEFDNANDNMKFNDKVKRNYNIIGRIKLRPRNTRDIFQNTWDVGTVTQQGGPSPIFKNISWKMNKKVEYTHTSDSFGTADPFMYPNQAYIPFVILHNASYASYLENEEGEVKQIAVTHNSCHWFNDA